MGRRVWKNQNGAWNTIVNKFDFRKEKDFLSREAKLKNSTLFFLSNVQDHTWWMEKIKEVRLRGAVLGVNLARFNRDGSKVEFPQKSDRVTVFSRLQGLNQTPPQVHVSNHPTQFGVKSFSSVVKGSESGSPGGTIALLPMNTESKKKLEYKGLVGEAKDIDTLNELKDLSCWLNGGRYSVKVSRWEKWFSRLYIWEGIPPIIERVAWIKVLGVPVCLLLVKSEAEESNGNFAEERLAILVWVEEISGQWHLDFLNDDCSGPGSPKSSSEFEESPSFGDPGVHGDSSDCSVTCMENVEGLSAPNPEVIGAEEKEIGDQLQSSSSFGEERERECGAGFQCFK
ncbi:hypothetical protein Hanom_Chr05g00403111 [Helianthus anomalus]